MKYDDFNKKEDAQGFPNNDSDDSEEKKEEEKPPAKVERP
tara:strand:+ start:271 stop:390 length:120 start_codon:yes stop_codon:yes gene_type:complete